MQQQIVVGMISKFPPKNFNGRLAYPVLPQGSSTWVSLYSDHPPQVGEPFVVDMTSNTSRDGKVYWNAQPVGAQPGQPKVEAPFSQPAPHGNGNGNGWPAPETQHRAPLPAPAPTFPQAQEPPKRFKLSFPDYMLLVEHVHEIAMRLEPDPTASQARMALVNAAVIAATQQNLETPTLEPGQDDGQEEPRPW